MCAQHENCLIFSRSFEYFLSPAPFLLCFSQFVIGLVSLMDKLFKRVNLDLQLTPYRVLATSARDGFLEFIPDSQVCVCAEWSRGGGLEDGS